MTSTDTIVAPATPPGRSAVALIRISGPDSLKILNAVFIPQRARQWHPWRMRLGEIVSGRENSPVDQVIAVWMPRLRSYTGEEAVEVTCHGSPIVIERIVNIFLQHGARLADPGEFTRRAFLNGQMDLAEAEAVCDMISAETEAAAEIAHRQLSGDLSVEIEAIRESILDLTAEVEANIDFSEEELPPANGTRWEAALVSVEQRITDLLKQSQRGRRLREGARVALVGRANVGKSSLFNALVGSERAIITPHPGTTRDTIEARLDLKGLAVDLVDTAGIRASEDEIERYGIERSLREMERAELIVWVLDTSQALQEDDRRLASQLQDKDMVIALNKSDLAPAWARESVAVKARAIRVSARTGEGLKDLEGMIYGELIGEESHHESADTLISNLRHIQALTEARSAIATARQALKNGESIEFVAVDLRTALEKTGSILGVGVSEEVLDRIFERFCIGK